MKPLVLAHSPDATRVFALGRRATDVEARLVATLPHPDDLDLDRPTVVLVDRGLLTSVPDARARLHALSLVAALVWCAAPGEAEPGEDVPVELLASYLPAGAPLTTVATLLRGAMRHAVAVRGERVARREADERLHEIAELAHVGASLGTERDLEQLLRLILGQARRLAVADAGSLYLVEREGHPGHPDAAEQRVLRFMLTQNDTLPELELGEFTLPIDGSSLAGYAAACDSVLSIPDVATTAPDAGYHLNRSFDDRSGYRTKSVLVIPLKTPRGDTVGVLQLINRKRTAAARLHTAADVEREVVPFDRRSVQLVGALAAQAGVAIENSRLYESIERLFEGFVTAAVTAIEARDPATSGHSVRVATLTVALAEALERGGRGPWRGVSFTREQLRELRYAALLHDFGKVGVREEVLVKAKKLYPAELEQIRFRLQRLAHAEELAYERARADLATACPAAAAEALAIAVARRDACRAHLGRLLRAVELANEPTVVTADICAELDALLHCSGSELGAGPLLRPEELRALRVRRGTLDESERREIEAHVTHTYRFLSQIPWTPELRRVPEIAYGHHEKLNGCGYPRGLVGEQLPVQVRVMTIADIYDALTAADRPYKRAVTPDAALDILRAECAAGELDADLLDTFLEAGIYRLIPSVRG